MYIITLNVSKLYYIYNSHCLYYNSKCFKTLLYYIIYYKSHCVYYKSYCVYYNSRYSNSHCVYYNFRCFKTLLYIIILIVYSKCHYIMEKYITFSAGLSEKASLNCRPSSYQIVFVYLYLASPACRVKFRENNKNYLLSSAVLLVKTIKTFKYSR